MTLFLSASVSLHIKEAQSDEPIKILVDKNEDKNCDGEKVKLCFLVDRITRKTETMFQRLGTVWVFTEMETGETVPLKVVLWI
ncbi:hypothetical protein V6Z12_D05G140500 [Gossypium hirsutum]